MRRTDRRACAYLCLCALLQVAVAACSRGPGALTPEEVAVENRAIGLMGQFDFERARAAFAQLAAAHPNRTDLEINLAVATLNRQQANDDEDARRAFESVLKSQADDVRAHYGLGLALLHDGNAREALTHFTFIADHGKADAYVQYFIAQSRSQLGDLAGALDGYQRALAAAPHMRSAAYGAFRTLQQMGRPDDAQRMLDVFRTLETNPQAEVVEFKYTRMGPLAEVRATSQPPRVRAVRPAGPVFERTALHLAAPLRPMTWRRFDAAHPASITAADIDGDGRVDLFIAGAIDEGGAVKNAVLLNREPAGFQIDLDNALARVPDVTAALWGDYDNDGLLDVYLCRHGANQLWRQTAKGVWSDVTGATGTAGAGGTTVDGAFFDADHDGDLDLLLVKSDAPNELLNNNGNNTFRALGAAVGLRGQSSGVVVADLDSDRDADIIVLGSTPPHQVLVNDRTWTYHHDSAFDRFEAAPMSAAVAGDVDADGGVELYTSGADGLERWTRAASGAWEPRAVGSTSGLAGTRQLALVDVDGDGQSDLLATDKGGRLQAFALSPAGDASPLFAADGPAVAGWALATFDATHGPSVVAMPMESGGPPVVWRPGTGRFNFATVTLTGQDRNGGRLRSNRSGLGASVAARADSRWTTFPALRAQSGPGQSLQPLAIGTGGEPQVDFVAITWSDGVFQTELAIVPGTIRQIGETERQLSSCPVLFAYDGKHFAFVTDLLGVGGMGTPTSPGVYDPPRPRESLLLPDGLLQSGPDRPAGLAVKITEPMEEVAYLDSAALLAYDVPPGWQLVLDERKAISAPEATGDARFFRTEKLPVQAVDDVAGDVTKTIVAVDGVAAPPGVLDRRFIGLTNPHSLTLRFDAPLDAVAGSPMLVADGWIEYPYAQTLFAAWQAGAAYQAPTIEARDDGGRWHTLRKEFGYPAGMARRMSVPLGTLPHGTRELRITTNQEIYWDRLAVAYAEACPLAVRHVLPLTSARLARTGFAAPKLAGDRRPLYDYDRRLPLWDTRYPGGAYTAEGEVTDLMSAEDGALAIIGPGEEVHLEFTAPDAPVRPGWTRRYVLDARGWCKDMDLYTKDGSTVEPLPGKRDGAASRLQTQRTTRYQSGR
ncbi:MAG TPA: FG-GAP-like repeat-containing protein [Vicinamibacterales bacterium]|jgi:tetratricopeptide (TPR) repeat protein